jgi:hypothetical protein
MHSLQRVQAPCTISRGGPRQSPPLNHHSNITRNAVYKQTNRYASSHVPTPKPPGAISRGDPRQDLCTAPPRTTPHRTALHCTALHCTALHCTALHCTAPHDTTRHGKAYPRTHRRFAPVSTHDCRGVLILDSGLTESFESGSESSQVCDSCRASRLAHQARLTVCDCCIPPHILISGDANHITISL